MPDWFPLPLEKYKQRAQLLNLPELYAVLDAIFANVRHNPAKVAALRTDADLHFFKNQMSMFARAAIHAYFDFLASEPPRVSTPPSNAGFAPPPSNAGFPSPPSNAGFASPPPNAGFAYPPSNVGFAFPPPAAPGRGSPPAASFDASPSPPPNEFQNGGDLATPVGSLSSSSSVSQLPPQNGASPWFSPSDPFRGAGLEMLDELGDLDLLGGGSSLGSLESAEGGDDDWSRQGDPVDTFLLDFDMDDVGGSLEESPADVSRGLLNFGGSAADVRGSFANGGGSSADVRGSGADGGGGFAEVSRGLDALSGAASGGSPQVGRRARKRPADVSVDVGEDPLGLRRAASDQGRAAGGYDFQENVLRLYPAAVATSPEAASVLRGLAEGKAGLGKAPGPLTQKLERLAREFDLDEQFESCSKDSEHSTEEGFEDGPLDETGGFCKGSLTKGRVTSGLGRHKAPSSGSSLDEFGETVDSLTGEMEALAFAPSMNREGEASLRYGTEGSGSVLPWGSLKAADVRRSDGMTSPPGKDATDSGGLRDRRENGGGVRRRMQELERRLGEAQERAQAQQRELEVRILSEA